MRVSFDQILCSEASGLVVVSERNLGSKDQVHGVLSMLVFERASKRGVKEVVC